MSKANSFIQLAEQEDGAEEWGFDLTSMKASDWEKMLKSVGITRKPVIKPSGAVSSYWFWVGQGIAIRTGNNPITGEYAYAGRRKNEKGYVGYIGIKGMKELVQKAAQIIRDKATGIKGESPHSSDFI